MKWSAFVVVSLLLNHAVGISSRNIKWMLIASMCVLAAVQKDTIRLKTAMDFLGVLARYWK